MDDLRRDLEELRRDFRALSNRAGIWAEITVWRATDVRAADGAVLSNAPLETTDLSGHLLQGPSHSNPWMATLELGSRVKVIDRLEPLTTLAWDLVPDPFLSVDEPWVARDEQGVPVCASPDLAWVYRIICFAWATPGREPNANRYRFSKVLGVNRSINCEREFLNSGSEAWSRTNLQHAIATWGTGHSLEDHDLQVWPPNRFFARMADVAMASAMFLRHVIKQLRLSGGPAARHDGRAEAAAMFRREGEVWRVRYCGEEQVVNDSKGIKIIHTLLAERAQVRTLSLYGGEPIASSSAPTQPMIDAEYLKQLKDKVADFDEELAEAEKHNDEGRIESLRQQRAVTLERLASDTGLGGRVRAFASEDEKARQAVFKNIKRACDKLRAVGLNDLAEHLSDSIKVSASESEYRPAKRPDWCLA